MVISTGRVGLFLWISLDNAESWEPFNLALFHNSRMPSKDQYSEAFVRGAGDSVESTSYTSMVHLGGNDVLVCYDRLGAPRHAFCRGLAAPTLHNPSLSNREWMGPSARRVRQLHGLLLLPVLSGSRQVGWRGHVGAVNPGHGNLSPGAGVQGKRVSCGLQWTEITSR